MKKIPTLFRRDPDNMRHVTREVHPDCQWVLDGEGVATRKYDGTCVMYDHAGLWWARREVKLGKPVPRNFLWIGTDEVTGKAVGWEPIEQSAFAKFHAEALNGAGSEPFEPGTYELIGVKINGNPEQVHPAVGHLLIAHVHAEPVETPRDFDGLAAFLAEFHHEGLVWHHSDGRMAKLKHRDFPTTTERTPTP